MDLVTERLPDCEETGGLILSLCHYFLLNGDLCQDPEMTVRLFPPGSTAFQHLVPSTDPALGRLEALTLMMAIPPVFRQVYPKPGAYVRSLRGELSDFLGQWLKNVEAHGHRPIEPD